MKLVGRMRLDARCWREGGVLDEWASGEVGPKAISLWWDGGVCSGCQNYATLTAAEFFWGSANYLIAFHLALYCKQFVYSLSEVEGTIGRFVEVVGASCNPTATEGWKNKSCNI